jgi:3-isopropylmalate/(R)-2-methylmalate dehydratase large subunit
MSETFVQKILGKKADRKVVPGDIVEVKPDVAMSHDNTAAIIQKFNSLGVDKIDDPDRHVVVLDHCVPAANEKFAQNHKEIREFVKKHGIKYFFDINMGISHQIMADKGIILPGEVLVGSDSHSTTYGAFGAFGTGIGRSEMAVILATGKIWFRVPETIKIVVHGEFAPGVSAKDLILKIIGDLKADGALYKAVEFMGPTIDNMTVASRMVLANMSIEMGGKIGYMIPNQATLDYLKGRAIRPFEIVESDPDAEFEAVYEFDVSDLDPQIACPHTVDNVKPISEVSGTKINEIFFGSCVNARLEDFEVVANILRSKKVHPDVRMIVIPASTNVYLEALKAGYVQDLIEAGCVMMNSGCGPCMGNHEGIPAPQETVLSTSNRNFRGRMGCVESEVYLCSPAIAAASAIKGKISDFRDLN